MSEHKPDLKDVGDTFLAACTAVSMLVPDGFGYVLTFVEQTGGGKATVFVGSNIESRNGDLSRVLREVAEHVAAHAGTPMRGKDKDEQQTE